MYEELVKRLRDDEAWENCDFDFIYGWMHEAADAIEVLSKKEKTTHWIPVTERLPEENGRYLVRYVRDIDLKGGVHSDEVRIMRFVDAQWRFPFICNPDVRKFVTREKVTHWMPLPEPPKEDG